MKPETNAELLQLAERLRILSNKIADEDRDVASRGDHVEIIKHFHQMRNASEVIKDCRKALEAMEDRLSREVIPDTFRAIRDKTGQKPPFYIEGVGRVSVSYRYSCTMLEKEKGIDWLKKNGHGGIVIETVNSQTLASFSKSLLEGEGKELPPDLFKVGTSPYTSITKA